MHWGLLHIYERALFKYNYIMGDIIVLHVSFRPISSENVHQPFTFENLSPIHSSLSENYHSSLSENGSP